MERYYLCLVERGVVLGIEKETSRQINKSNNSFTIKETVTHTVSAADILSLKLSVESELLMLASQRQSLDKREAELNEKLSQINAALEVK